VLRKSEFLVKTQKRTVEKIGISNLLVKSAFPLSDGNSVADIETQIQPDAVAPSRLLRRAWACIIYLSVFNSK
jgi:hypothetical protein